MIHRGRRSGLYLYEITESDLVLSTKPGENYAAGNILIFANKKNISLGAELAKADDLNTANEYLDNSDGLLLDHYKQLEETVAAQQEKIDQRDNLLSDLSEDLSSQKYSNQVLIAQLEQFRTQIEIERLSREEAVDDLQQVSIDTQNLGSELAKVIDDKLKLEQELAASITDLLELNLQNDELKRSLQTQTEILKSASGNTESTINPVAIEQSQAETQQAEAHLTQKPILENTSSAQGAGEILTMASGKQIHIYHDFPTDPGGRTIWLFKGTNWLRIVLALIATLIVAGATSVIATSRTNGISFGESLDLLLKTFGL